MTGPGDHHKTNKIIGCYSSPNTSVCTLNTEDDILNLEDNSECDFGTCLGLHKPFVPGYLVPKVGTIFPSYDAAFKFYTTYAKEAGFSIKLGTNGVYDDFSFRKQDIHCNRHGNPRNLQNINVCNTKGKQKNRKSFYSVTGCKAMITLHRDSKTDTFLVTKFTEGHNHEVNKMDEQIFSPQYRRLQISDKIFIFKASTLNIGATKAHKLKASLVGGYSQLLPSKVDYKNFWRDYTTAIGPTDAQCIVDTLMERREKDPGFFVKHRLQGKVLCGILWVDAISKENYSKFSDVIAMDATYRTNKYKMIFVPFTAINNHDKTITVGAALLCDEKVESYVWLLETFLEAHGKPPTLILSDQDPSLSLAIAKVLPMSKHRLCMWHIMSKLQNKISEDTMKNEAFKSRIHKLVWNKYIDTSEFEKRWKYMLSDFGLKENKWLDDMYKIRSDWIPAYFRHIPLCGLMKTTSRSESSNSFFNGFVNSNNLLINFMINYDTAISKQRHDTRIVEVASRNTMPKLLSMENPLQIETHASMVYTREIFLKVQKQISKASTLCSIKKRRRYAGALVFTISYKNKKTGEESYYKVKFDESKQSVSCCCDMFTLFGVLCSHALHVLMDNKIEKIPDMYILPRWRKSAITYNHVEHNHGWNICNTRKAKLIQKASNTAERSINVVANDEMKLESLINILQSFLDKNESEIVSHPRKNNINEVIDNVFGISLPKYISIEAPSGIRNKGGGKRTRIISASEKIRLRSLKPKRLCHGCNVYVHHDQRTCPINPIKRLRPHKK